jgi:hypothetical protein
MLTQPAEVAGTEDEEDAVVGRGDQRRHILEEVNVPAVPLG